MADPTKEEVVTLLSDLLTRYFLPATPGKTLQNVLDSINDPQSRVQNLKIHFERNPFYLLYLLQTDALQERLRSWEEEEQANPRKNSVILERTLNLMGSQAIRNTVAAIRVNRIAEQGLPRKKSDKLILSSPDLLKRAIAAEDFCENERLGFGRDAFCAGLHYDLLSAQFNAKKASAEAKTELEAAWTQGWSTARAMHLLVSATKNFTHSRYAFGAGFLIHLGKPLMAITYPKERGDKSWGAFKKECEKYRSKSALAFSLFEKNTFPVTHAELSSLMVSSFALFRPVEKAIFYYRQPQFLKPVDSDLYKMAAYLYIADLLTDKSAPLEERLARIPRGLLKDMKLDAEDLLSLFRENKEKSA
jgi:hypothetical protein